MRVALTEYRPVSKDRLRLSQKSHYKPPHLMVVSLTGDAVDAFITSENRCMAKERKQARNPTRKPKTTCRETYAGVGSRAIVRTFIHADLAINTVSVSGKRNRKIRGRVAATKGLLTYAAGAPPDKAEGRTPARNFGGYALLVSYVTNCCSCDTVLSRKLHPRPETAPQPR